MQAAEIVISGSVLWIRLPEAGDQITSRSDDLGEISVPVTSQRPSRMALAQAMSSRWRG